MIDLPWKVFSQTGNIETYLLMKEMEQQQNGETESGMNDSVPVQEANS
ncbi:YqzL family protein [Thalassobacillus hwangdonensis]|uniref:YqzL family protein n=1 Tax=Thalassobacillus hwangdonensis TaxID=546108 RepID=A0ABW3L094_9BACI